MYDKLETLSSTSVGALPPTVAITPENTTALDLRWNWLCRRAAKELNTLFGGISPRVTFLDLSGNALYLKSAKELARAFGCIPANVTSLNLSGNDFYQKTVADLVKIWGAFLKVSHL
jgi:hypothetical protein